VNQQPENAASASADIIERTVLTRAALRRNRPAPTGSTAVVYLDRHGRLYLAHRPLTAAEAYLTTPREMYTVDTSEHPVTVELDLPTRQEVFSFHATVHLSWRVLDPIAAVRSGLADPKPIYTPFLEQQLCEIARAYDTDQNAQAERDMNAQFAGRIVEIAQGLTFSRFSARLSLDGSTRQYIAEQTYADRKEQRRQRERDMNIRNATRDLDEIKAHHQVRELEAQYQQQLAMLEEKHQLAVEQERMAFYAEALRTDQLNLIALRLSTNRDDVNDVINLFMRQRQLDFDGARGVVNALLEQKLVNRSDVTDIMARATKVLADHISGTPFSVKAGEGTVRELQPGSSQPRVDATDLEDDDDDDDELDDDDQPG